MNEILIFVYWAFCLAPFLGLMFYLNPGGGRISVLKSKGIYNPVFGMKIMLLYIVVLLSLEYLHLSVFYEYINDFDACAIALMYPPMFVFLSVLWGCKLFLPRINTRQIRKISPKTNYHRLAVQMTILCLLSSFVFYVYQRALAWYIDEAASFWANVAAIFLVMVLSYKLYTEINRYEKLKSYADRSISGLETRRASIIFLRSFIIDKKQINGRTFDEYICENFPMSMQPIISLSDPDDYLPTGGSLKVQSKDEYWEQTVNILIQNCRAIVIFEGKSDGLQTEMAKIRRFSIPYDKVFVATPPRKYRVRAWYEGAIGDIKYALNYIWKDFSSAMSRIGGMHSLPMSDPGSSVLFSFDSSWNAVNEGIFEGKDFFENIMQKTVKYETLACDYKSLALSLRKNEVEMEITDAENRKIKNAIMKIWIFTFGLSSIFIFSFSYLVFIIGG